jgi:cytoskeletal protein RodZ
MGDDGATGGDLSAFGRWLVQERELRGLGRDEVTRATKLAPGLVEALESGEEARMPPRAYVVGYLRAYAHALGLDADEVVLRYQEAAGPKAAPARGRQPGPPSRTALVVVVAVAAAGALLWILLGS